MNKIRGRWMRQRYFFCFRNKQNMSSSAVDVAYYSYEKMGEGKTIGHPMIILHGLMGSRQNWQSLTKLFGKTGRRVIAVDARNHGESVHVEDMNYFVFRDDVLRLMDNQHIEKAVILGHSMGGKTAMTTALTSPERVAGLVIVDVSPTVSPSVNKHPLYLEAMLRIPLMTLHDDRGTSLSTVRNHVLHQLSKSVQVKSNYSVASWTLQCQWMSHYIFSSPEHEVLKDEAMQHFLASNLIVKDDKFHWRCNLDSIINNFPSIASFPRFDTEQYLGNTLFLGGSKSDYIRFEHYPMIKKLFPLAETQHIHGAGHWVHAEKPQLFLNTVNKFLINSGL